VVQAPLFSEDISVHIAYILKEVLVCDWDMEDTMPDLDVKQQSIVKSKKVQFSMKYSAISSIGHRCNNQVFFCIVTQSREEFIYQTRKIALAIDDLAQLQGFIIVLLAGLGNSETDENSYRFTTKAIFPPMEYAVLSCSRQDFYKFKLHASRYLTVKDWEGEYNFTRFVCHDSWPLDGPRRSLVKSGKDLQWDHFCKVFATIVDSYRASVGSNPLVEPLESFYIRPDLPSTSPEAGHNLNPRSMSPEAPSFLKRIPGTVFTKLHRALVKIAGDIRETRNGGDGPSRGWLSQAQNPYGSEGTFRTVLYPSHDCE